LVCREFLAEREETLNDFNRFRWIGTERAKLFAERLMEYWNIGIMIKTKDLLLGKFSNIRVFQYSNVPLFLSS